MTHLQQGMPEEIIASGDRRVVFSPNRLRAARKRNQNFKLQKNL
jgi:hypothetical protein